jgi:hypothetical protein
MFCLLLRASPSHPKGLANGRGGVLASAAGRQVGEAADRTIYLPFRVPTMPSRVPTMPVRVPTMPVRVPTMPSRVPTMPVRVPTMPVRVPTMPFRVLTMPTGPTTGRCAGGRGGRQDRCACDRQPSPARVVAAKHGVGVRHRAEHSALPATTSALGLGSPLPKLHSWVGVCLFSPSREWRRR